MLKKITRKPNHHHPRRPFRTLLLILLSIFLLLFIYLYYCNGHTAFTRQISTPILLQTKETMLETESGYNPHISNGPYHDWQLFAADFEKMKQNLKIFVYGDAFSDKKPIMPNSSFSHIFLPYKDPFNRKIGNYFSEHMFKLSLLRSSLFTEKPEQANFFFLPFSINALRNEARVHSADAISNFVAEYANRVSFQFPFFNASGGADHFYVCCHSIGGGAASKHEYLLNNAIQVTCCSSYFHRNYLPHKDVSLPQVWPRGGGGGGGGGIQQSSSLPTNPPHQRHRLAFYAGRTQNSPVRQELISLWGNDTDMDIYGGNSPIPYEQGFRNSKYCLHVRGYEVNTARISDAINFGCVPVIISNHYDLPFANVLDWTKFSVTVNNRELPFLKKRLLSVTNENYLRMYRNLFNVQRHFVWHTTPKGYDSFYMTAYQLWLRRSIHRLPYD
ncbi:probable glycosyltransferase At5g03795 [Rutidosis leptorrhynchoides]|uniref:probable glycosyltransferase At5g03795 n=1 Tax=Rutidosis leptorrhynchoides TaxID=125765 RepID=UPI003A98FE2F